MADPLDPTRETDRREPERDDPQTDPPAATPEGNEAGAADPINRDGPLTTGDTHFVPPSVPPTPPVPPAPPARAAPLPVARKVIPGYAGSVTRVAHPYLALELPRRTCGVDILYFLILCIGIIFLIPEMIVVFGTELLGMAPAPGGDDSAGFDRSLIVPLLIVRTAATLLVVWAMCRNRGVTLASVGVRWRIDSRWLVDVLLGFAAMITCYIFVYAWGMVSYFLLPKARDGMLQNADQLLETLPRMAPATMVVVSIAIGVYEELIFRGFIMSRLRRWMSSWVAAIVLNVVVFTLLHLLDQTLAALVPIGILAIVFSLVTAWRKTILPAVVGHALFDLLQFIGLFYFVSPDG